MMSRDHTMRSFVALPLPEQVCVALSHIQQAIRTLPAEGNRLSYAKRFHLTLLFLGEISGQESARAQKALSAIVFRPFVCQSTLLSFFPNSRAIRVVHIELEHHPSLMALQKQIASALSFLPAANADKKPFVPHLTLARVKHLTNPAGFCNALSSLPVPVLQVPVDKIVLFKSILTPQGPLYEKIYEHRGVPPSSDIT
ncbi:RNA 2',3'-cyclic phosphodiesterase [Candidatus Woesearchaeota archaeon CG_4_10_14_0_8_um_filter_47_5]|nr:MAG: RNA 2',3'-cyclic phosphodiesterase [Candidatus Woesearchaeota archaeon CG_4_10_14_0_8_um_filter_47_5]